MIKVNGSVLHKEYFPDNTFRIRQFIEDKKIEIEWLYENEEELIALYFLNKHIREHGFVESIILKMPYIPNARMDRVKNDDEIFTLKYFAEFINSMEFDKVIVKDAHSNVSLALINKVESEDISKNIRCLVDKLLIDKQDIIFYPDEGACKRYSEIIEYKNAFGIKKRNWRTGKILGIDVNGHIPKEKFNVLIVDDICSYGGTFYHSANKLKELGADKIYLYVTHCENNILKGELLKGDLIEKIYTTESIFTEENEKIEILRGI